MKVLLISVQKNLNILGLKLLHKILLLNGHESVLLYLTRFNIENNKMLEALEGFVRELSPEWVGISLTASEFRSAKDVTLFLKNKFTSFPIIWGGIHPTSAPLRCAQYADYLCIGEGEKSILDVCRAINDGKSLKTVNNMAWLDGKELIRNPLNPLIEDLDSLPYVPRLTPNAFILYKDKVHLLTKKLYTKHSAFNGGIYRIVSSRGCVYNCTYCVNSVFPKLYEKWRIRWTSPERMVDEISAGVSEELPLLFVSILDDNFFAQKMETLERFFYLYKQKVAKPFIALGSPNFVNEEKIKVAVDAGLASLHIGLQTGSEQICKDIYKRSFLSGRYKKIGEIIHKYPIVPYYDVICDNPYETEEDEINTVKMLTELPKPYFFLLYSLTLYEGTELREKVEKEKPEYLHDDTEKDFLTTANTPLNLLKQFAAIYPKFFVNYLLKIYQKKPEGLYTKAIIKLSKLMCITIAQPIIFLWILLRFNRYSIKNFVKSLPNFLDIRLFHIFGHFHTNKDTTLE